MLPVHVLMLQASGTPQGQSPFGMLFMFGAIFAIFYFLLIRPQRNQQKAHDEMVAALSKGDDVATIAQPILDLSNARQEEAVPVEYLAPLGSQDATRDTLRPLLSNELRFDAAVDRAARRRRGAA